jgi:signal peptidase I
VHCVLLLLQVVVVLSGSMEPGFQRGDILFLNMGTAPVRTGELCFMPSMTIT